MKPCIVGWISAVGHLKLLGCLGTGLELGLAGQCPPVAGFDS